MLQAIQANSTAIGTIAIVNRQVAKGLLTKVVTDVVEFLNVGMTMTVNQIEMVVELMLKDTLIKNLKPEDFKVCFDQFKKYGKTWNRIDGQVIFAEVQKYASERMDFCEQENIGNHNSNVSKTPLVAPQVIEMYKEIIDLRKKGLIERSNLIPVEIKIVDSEVDGKKVKYVSKVVEEKDMEVKKSKKIEKSDRDKFIQDCFMEHYKIWLKTPCKTPKHAKLKGEVLGDVSGRFIEFEGKIVDEIEYTQLRVNQYDNQK